MFRDIADLVDYYFYSYEHLDDLNFLRAPADVFRDLGLESCQVWKEAVTAALEAAGWEGDGDLAIMWFPPFVSVGIHDTWGTYVWVVKQRNNGTAWLASPVELRFPRLAGQNSSRTVWREFVPVTRSKATTEAFLEDIAKHVQKMERELGVLSGLPDADSIRDAVSENVQGRLVQSLHEHMDWCYLEALREVIIEGNTSGLRLPKAAVKLSLGDYLPDGVDEDRDSFFTLHGIVSDTWKAFRFTGFDEKIRALRKAIDLEADEARDFQLRKHVGLRNAVQHHEGMFALETVRKLGRDALSMQGPNGELTLNAPAPIRFPKEEIHELARVLRTFATALEAQFDARVAGRTYVNKSDV